MSEAYVEALKLQIWVLKKEAENRLELLEELKNELERFEVEEVSTIELEPKDEDIVADLDIEDLYCDTEVYDMAKESEASDDKDTNETKDGFESQ